MSRRQARALLGGKVSAGELAEGGFLKRANQRDLLRMAGMPWGSGKDKEERLDAATREADKSLSRQNAYACAIDLLKSSALHGQPTRVFRLGEYIPFLLVAKSGGAGGGAKQFENVGSPDEAVLRATPVNLKLLYSNRLLPALFGQVWPPALTLAPQP